MWFCRYDEEWVRLKDDAIIVKAQIDATISYTPALANAVMTVHAVVSDDSCRLWRCLCHNREGLRIAGGKRVKYWTSVK